MSPLDLEKAWDEIGLQADTDTSGPYLHLQIKGGNLPIGVILRAKDRRPGLLIRFSSKDLHHLPQSNSGRGFSFEHPVPAGNGKLGLPILLGDPAVADLFALMGADLVSEIERPGTDGTVLDRVLRRIALWRRFLQIPRALMSKEELFGLFGELHIFSQVITADGADAALDAWHGPDRKLQDFHFTDCLVEVKTWRIESGARIYISHPDQIGLDSNRPLYIAAVKISVDGASGRTLQETVVVLRSRMNSLQAQRLDELLAEYGYIAQQAEKYPDRIQVLGVNIYKISEGFPYVDVRSIPGGVVELQYAIELGALGKFLTNNPHLPPNHEH